MGKIILTVEGSTVGAVAEGRGIVVEREVSEQDSARLIMAYGALYADKWVDEAGNPREPSYGEIIEAWFDGIVAGSAAVVQRHEQDKAAEAAREAVKPIAVTKS